MTDKLIVTYASEPHRGYDVNGILFYLLYLLFVGLFLYEGEQCGTLATDDMLIAQIQIFFGLNWQSVLSLYVR